MIFNSLVGPHPNPAGSNPAGRSQIGLLQPQRQS